MILFYFSREYEYWQIFCHSTYVWNDYKSTAIIDFGIVYNLDIRLIYKNEIHE